MLTKDYNHLRKAQRINIPIYFSYNNHTYEVSDWSTIGIGIINDDESPLNLKIGDKIKGYIILPTGKSSIFLEVTIELKAIKGNNYGFKIIEIEEKNRYVLRHYATIAIEGGKDRLEELASDLFTPDIQSPIKESVTLSEDENNILVKKFNKRVYLYAVAIILFLAFSLYTAFYNYTIMYKKVGIVSGNIEKIVAPISGIVEKIYVKNNEPIFKGQLLLKITNQNLIDKIEELKLKLKTLKSTLVKKQQKLKSLQKENQKNSKIKKQILSQKENLLHQAYASLQEANELFAKRLISINQLESIQKIYDQRLSSYQNLKLQKTDNKELVSLQNEVDNLISKYNTLQNQLKSFNLSSISQTIKSNNNGKIYSILVSKSQYVNQGKALLYINTDKKSNIITKLTDRESKDIILGQKCIVYSKITHKYYRGHIEAVGFSATGADVSNSLEVSLNEVPIRISLVDNISLPINTRVDVWILRKDNSIRQYLEKIFW